MAENPYAKYANPYAGLIPVGPPDANKPLETQGKQLSNTRTQQEIDYDNATAAARAAKAKADALKAEIDAKNAKEQYDAQHRPVSTTGTYGADYLKTLSPSDQATVRALDEGRLAFPMNAGMRSPFWQEKLSQVAQYDPNFDATNFNARAKGRAAAISGKLGGSNNALNTAIGHLGQLYSQIDGTASHGGFPFATTVNAIENSYAKGHGDPGITNFQQTAGLVADELEAAYRNGGGAEAGVIRQLRSLDPNMSREQKAGIVRNAMDLLSSKIQANLAQYNFGTGGKPTWDMLDQHTRDVLSSPAFSDIRDKYFAAPANATGGGSPPPPGGSTNGGLGPSSNGFNEVPNPEATAFWDSAAHQGIPYKQALEQARIAAAGRGNAVTTPVDPAQYAKAVAYIRQHPNTDYHPFQAVTRTPLTGLSAVTNDAAQNPGGAFAAHYFNSMSGGLLNRAAGDQGAYFNEVSRQQNPGASFLGDLGGTIGGAVGAGKVVGKAAPFLGKFGSLINANPARQALTGDMLFGGTSGAIQNPDNPVMGAVGGAGSMLAGNVAGRYLLGPALAAAGDTTLGQGIANKVLQAKGLFTRSDAGTFNPPAALDPGQSLVMSNLGKDMGDIRTNLQDAANADLPYALADAHPKLRTLAGSAVRKSPDVRTMAENIIAPRQLGQAERAIGQVNNLAPVGDVPTLQADLLKTARAQSAPLYAQAKSQPVPELTANPALKEVLDRPAAQAAIRKGYETALNNGEDVGTLTYATDPNGNPVQYGNPSWNIIHYARQELDKSGETAVRQALDKQISGINPGFKAADAKYAQFLKGSDALQAGADATKIAVTPEATDRALASFQNNLPQFQQGYASSLADQIERARLSSDPYNLINGSLGQQAKLRTVFPQGADAFNRAHALEGDMSKTAYETLGGSPTQARSEADAMFNNPKMDAALELGTSLATGAPPLRTLGRVAQKFGDIGRLGVRGAQAKADALGPILLNPDPAANLANLDQLTRINLARQAYLARIGAASGQVGSGMFGAPLIYGLSQN